MAAQSRLRRRSARSSWPAGRVANALRMLVVALCLVLAATGPDPDQSLVWWPVVVAGALLAAWRQDGVAGRLLRLLETAAYCIAVAESLRPTSPFLPALIAPSFAAGLTTGAAAVIAVPGFASLVLVIAVHWVHHSQSLVPTFVEWVALAAASALVAAWIRRLLDGEQRLAPSNVNASYAAAYRLLAQLQPVARELSAGLYPATIAESVLQSLARDVGFDRGAVFVRTGAGRLVPIATHGASRVDWVVDVAGDTPFADAWMSQRPQRRNRQLSGPAGSSLVVPLVVGTRSFGVVGVEAASRSVGPEHAAKAMEIVSEAAMRLETALLFDEVRESATAEERRRVAREIHDGIAQELSYLGYFVDGLAADARRRGDVMEAELVTLRAEITRFVHELRMSIFDLRSEVDGHGGLGLALSEYIRSFGRRTGLTVHLSLNEAPNRLPAETEAELLRIAQEAITNVRKHARAENLWVTLEVDPPVAHLRIEDDGRGLGPVRFDSYGLQIMRERASRLRTTVDVQPRRPRGTSVDIRLGGSSQSGDPLAPDPEVAELVR
jgi:signal transduction histidine kinase